VHEEEFMKGLGVLSELKFRASYGVTGNQSIPMYRSLPSTSNVNYPFGGAVSVGIIHDQLGNPNLKWETTVQNDLGFDLGFWEDRVMITFDWYKKQPMTFYWQLQCLAQVVFQPCCKYRCHRAIGYGMVCNGSSY
jgi:TonB-dependent starch-binding outer membrane protein SusC